MDSLQSLQQLKLPVSDLALGMYISGLDRPWEETPFLYQGFLLERISDLTLLQETCDYVFIDLVEESTTTDSGSETKKRYYINKISVNREIPKAITTFKTAQQEMHLMLKGLKLGAAIDIDKTKSVVSTCVESILRNQDALTFLAKIKHSDECTAEHSLQVCMLAISFAKHLGLAEFELENIGVCALLHDIGTVKIPEDILNKKGKLTDNEFRIYQQHPLFGKNLLMSKSSLYSGVVDVAYTHHERVDGKGYPRGIKGDKIPFFSKIIAIVDAYTNLTADGRHGLPLPSIEALRILYDRRNTYYDSALVLQFIKLMGVYPPGNIVEMSNGEVGIILSAGSRYKLRPKVLLVLDHNKQPAPKTVVDLAKGATDFFGKPYIVRRIHAEGTYGLNIQDVEFGDS